MPAGAKQLGLAEDLAVLDNIAPGRIWFTAGMGYRPHEFEMFGRDPTKKLRIMNETMAALKSAWTGEPFDGSEAGLRRAAVHFPMLALKAPRAAAKDVVVVDSTRT